MADKPRVPLGLPVRWTAAQRARLITGTPALDAIAVAFWRQHAAGLRALLPPPPKERT